MDGIVGETKSNPILFFKKKIKQLKGCDKMSMWSHIVATIYVETYLEVEDIA